MLPASSAGGGGGIYQILLPEHKTWETMTKTSKAWIFRIAEALEKFQDTGKKLPFFPGEQAQGPVQFRDLDSFPAAARKARHCSRGESWTPPPSWTSPHLSRKHTWQMKGSSTKCLCDVQEDRQPSALLCSCSLPPPSASLTPGNFHTPGG